jgi:hypothetical protein
MNGQPKVDKSMWNGDESCALSALNAVQRAFTKTAKDIFPTAAAFNVIFAELVAIAFPKKEHKDTYKKLQDGR